MGYQNQRKTKTQCMRFFKVSAFVGVFSILLLSQLVSANPPSNMVLSYDLTTQTLTVTIIHPVTTNDHYIKEVEIQKNGQAYNTSLYTEQPDPASYTYNVNATNGDSIEVTASCSLYGSITKQLTVTNGTGKTDNKSTPGFEIMLVLGATVMIVFLNQRRSKK